MSEFVNQTEYVRKNYRRIVVEVYVDDNYNDLTIGREITEIVQERFMGVHSASYTIQDVTYMVPRN